MALVKSLPQQQEVLTRHRSCHCTDCILDDEDQCKKKEWVDDWKEVEIKREAFPSHHQAVHSHISSG